MILRQSTAVAVGGRALLIEGPPGAGKSSLALALIDRGATLIGDDGVALRRDGDRLILAPPPATEGLIELRGIGLVSLPTTAAPAGLLLRLDEDPVRLPDTLRTVRIEEIEVPCLPFDTRNPAAAVRAEHALALHGLAVPPVAAGRGCLYPGR